MEMTESPIFAEVAVILQFARDNSLVNNIVTRRVACLDLKNPSEMTVWIKRVVF